MWKRVTWANEMNFGMYLIAGTGLITVPLLHPPTSIYACIDDIISCIKYLQFIRYFQKSTIHERYNVFRRVQYMKDTIFSEEYNT